MIKPWWYPKLTDHEWCESKRADYPEDAGLSDDAIRTKYADGCKYQTLWDLVGDAREEHEKLADAYCKLCARVEELTDKALRFDLDQAGIEAREREAVELVELRAKVAELERHLERSQGAEAD